MQFWRDKNCIELLRQKIACVNGPLCCSHLRISISTRKTNMIVFLVLMLILMRLCLSASENSITQISGFALFMFLLISGNLKARLHRRFLSRQLDAIFVALKLQQVSNMFETPCDIAATNRTEIAPCLHVRDKNCIELSRPKSPCKRALRHGSTLNMTLFCFKEKLLFDLTEICRIPSN